MKRSWKKLSGRVIYRNSWIALHEDRVRFPKGRGVYAFIEKEPCAVIIPVTRQGKLLLVGQWRYPTRKFSWEFPMGALDHGERALNAAKRELLEEANMRAKVWKQVGSFYPANGVMSQVMHTFFAQQLSAAVGEADETEELLRRQVSVATMRRLIRTSVITDAPTIAAFAQADAQGLFRRL